MAAGTITRMDEQTLAALSADEKVRELLNLWRDHYNSCTPVTQADTLLQFSNAIYHLGADITGDVTWLTDER